MSNDINYLSIQIKPLFILCVKKNLIVVLNEKKSTSSTSLLISGRPPMILKRIKRYLSVLAVEKKKN